MAKLHRLDARNLLFQCPACAQPHYVRTIGPGPVWEWNQDLDLPTFSPTIIFHSQSDTARCHSSVKEGKIEFLSDSKHSLAGRLVDLPEWPESL